MAQLNFRTYDRENKATSLTILADDLVTSPNVQALADALDAVIRGSAIRATSSIITVVDAGAAGPSTDIDAQRGNKWLMRVDVPLDKQGVGAVYTHELGTCDNSVLSAPADDFLDLSAGVGATLKAAFELIYESPEGNPGTLLSVQQVNRALN